MCTLCNEYGLGRVTSPSHLSHTTAANMDADQNEVIDKPLYSSVSSISAANKYKDFGPFAQRAKYEELIGQRLVKYYAGHNEMVGATVVRIVDNNGKPFLELDCDDDIKEVSSYDAVRKLVKQTICQNRLQK